MAHMIAISSSLTARASIDFELVRNLAGRRKQEERQERTNRSKVASVFAIEQKSAAPARKVTRVINAVLKTLSLKAPRNWVKKKAGNVVRPSAGIGNSLILSCFECDRRRSGPRRPRPCA